MDRDTGYKRKGFSDMNTGQEIQGVGYSAAKPQIKKFPDHRH